MIHTDASESLAGYKQWRKNLQLLPVGTRIKWNIKSRGINNSHDINPGQCFEIIEYRNDINQKLTADRVYVMLQISKTGKRFTRKMYWSVEGIARRLHNKEVEILNG
jgi:hypothetical protein